jgi:hypothetical protein
MPSGTSDVGFDTGFVAGFVVVGLADVGALVGCDAIVAGFAGTGSVTATTGGFVVDVGGGAAVAGDPTLAVDTDAVSDVGAPVGTDGAEFPMAVGDERGSAASGGAAASAGAFAARVVAVLVVTAALRLEVGAVEAGAADGEEVALSEPPRVSQRPAPPNAAAPSASPIQRDEVFVVGGAGSLSLG